MYSHYPLCCCFAVHAMVDSVSGTLPLAPKSVPFQFQTFARMTFLPDDVPSPP
jgi:hypothetical protein